MTDHHAPRHSPANPSHHHEPRYDSGSVLEAAGVDPNRTPVDRLSEAAQWALANHYFLWESDVTE